MILDRPTRNARTCSLSLRSNLTAITLAVSLFAASSLCAQELRHWEGFGGFSYAHANLGEQSTLFLPRTQNYYGIHLATTFNPNRYMRLRLFDFAVQMGPTSNPEPPGLTADIRTFQMLLGPEFVLRSRRTSAFAHTLFGLTNTRLVERIGGYDVVPDLVARTNLAFGVGGGLDTRITRNFDYRLCEIDYIPTRLAGTWTNHVRISSGVVYRFGSPLSH